MKKGAYSWARLRKKASALSAIPIKVATGNTVLEAPGRPAVAAAFPLRHLSQRCNYVRCWGNIGSARYTLDMMLLTPKGDAPMPPIIAMQGTQEADGLAGGASAGASRRAGTGAT